MKSKPKLPTFLAVSIAIALGIVCASALDASGQTQQIEAEPNSLVDIKPVKPSAVIVQEPLGLDFKVYELKGGTPVVVFHTGTLKRVVLLTFANGEVVPEVTQWVVTVGGDVPPPKPPEPLEGFAAEVDKQADKVNLSRGDRVTAAQDFEAIASMTAAGAIQKIEDAVAELAGRQSDFWPRSAEPFVRWLETEIGNRVQSLATLAEVFTDIGRGLRGE